MKFVSSPCHVLQFFTACLFLIHFYGSNFFISAAPAMPSETQAMKYLQQFGYMEKSDSVSLVSKESVSKAIEDFQRFMGLAETGVLDSSTLKMMSMPRCGVPDKIGHSGLARRKKRYALLGSKWLVTDFTYKISKYPSGLRDKQMVDNEIARAFKVWSDVTPLNFINSDKGRAHIDIRFEKGEHGHGGAFDGPGYTLAHAFPPDSGGDAHFDDEETWTIKEDYGINLFQVAAHEFGHSLGLFHSDVKASLMWSAYEGYKPYFTLHKDDILGIQELYGRPKNMAPDLCQDSKIDAATRTQDGRTYVFRGDYFWEIVDTGISDNTRIGDGYPRKISTDWSGLPGNLDAAITWIDGRTFFFKKNKVWSFHNRNMDSGYPRDISGAFPGIPDDIDAAVAWSGNGLSYFFKGENYWRYDTSQKPFVSSNYPLPISGWNGLPNNMNAAFQWSNKKTYFFKGRQYYLYNDETSSVENGNPAYPRSTSAWWFGC